MPTAIQSSVIQSALRLGAQSVPLNPTFAPIGVTFTVFAAPPHVRGPRHARRHFPPSAILHKIVISGSITNSRGSALIGRDAPPCRDALRAPRTPTTAAEAQCMIIMWFLARRTTALWPQHTTATTTTTKLRAARAARTGTTPAREAQDTAAIPLQMSIPALPLAVTAATSTCLRHR